MTAPDLLDIHVSITDPVGVQEVANRLGVKPKTVAQWKFRGLLPEPRAVVSHVPIWEWTTIEAWARSTGRLS